MTVENMDRSTIISKKHLDEETMNSVELKSILKTGQYKRNLSISNEKHKKQVHWNPILERREIDNINEERDSNSKNRENLQINRNKIQHCKPKSKTSLPSITSARPRLVKSIKYYVPKEISRRYKIGGNKQRAKEKRLLIKHMKHQVALSKMNAALKNAIIVAQRWSLISEFKIARKSASITCASAVDSKNTSPCRAAGYRTVQCYFADESQSIRETRVKPGHPNEQERFTILIDSAHLGAIVESNGNGKFSMESRTILNKNYLDMIELVLDRCC